MANADDLFPFLVRPKCLKPELFLCDMQASITTSIFMQVGETGADPKRDVQWSVLNPPGGTGH
jgi:hypothetical protein